MPTITTKDGTEITTRTGERPAGCVQPRVALSADAWDDQMLFLAKRGYRCIAHDRRGTALGPAVTATTWIPTRDLRPWSRSST